MIEFLIFGLAVHILPNIMMKIIKNTKLGHKLLTYTFELGMQHGKKGIILHYNFRSIIEYGIGPEIATEYYIGLEIGKLEAKERKSFKNEFIQGFFETVEENLDTMTNEEMKEINKTPIISTVSNYVRRDKQKGINDLKYLTVKEGRVTKLNIFINILLLVLLSLINFHLLIQPIICFIRKQTAKSKFGKKVLKGNFQKGYNGYNISFTKNVAIDLLISPAVLDPMRIGRTIRNFK